MRNKIPAGIVGWRAGVAARLLPMKPSANGGRRNRPLGLLSHFLPAPQHLLDTDRSISATAIGWPGGGQARRRPTRMAVTTGPSLRGWIIHARIYVLPNGDVLGGRKPQCAARSRATARVSKAGLYKRAQSWAGRWYAERANRINAGLA